MGPMTFYFIWYGGVWFTLTESSVPDENLVEEFGQPKLIMSIPADTIEQAQAVLAELQQQFFSASITYVPAAPDAIVVDPAHVDGLPEPAAPFVSAQALPEPPEEEVPAQGEEA